jgi:hypothetical protein
MALYRHMPGDRVDVQRAISTDWGGLGVAFGI